jgi:MerR family transcriptional regulator, copper efflux regulator
MLQCQALLAKSHLLNGSTMNISQLAKAINVSTDTVRYYEKQGLLSAPERQTNGYRSYTEAHVEMLRFVRGAQALGFSLTEIRIILPQLALGTFGRTEIEQQLRTKIAQIDAHMAQLKTLKKELTSTFDSLRCSPTQRVSTAHATASDSGSGAGVAVARRSFTERLPRSKRIQVFSDTFSSTSAS